MAADRKSLVHIGKEVEKLLMRGPKLVQLSSVHRGNFPSRKGITLLHHAFLQHTTCEVLSDGEQPLMCSQSGQLDPCWYHWATA